MFTQLRAIACDNLSTHTAGASYEPFPDPKRTPDSASVSDARIQWKFTTQKARDKLARAYPDIP